VEYPHFLNNVFESDVIERDRKVSVAGRLVTDTAVCKDNWESLLRKPSDPGEQISG
jgi:hypothetical protein